MATAMAVPPLAPRPSPRPIAAWSPPKHHSDGKENRPALKQLQQSASPARARRERPCDGCRRRKSKCVIQDSGICVLCEFHKQSCTFVENAQPRKRKQLEDASKTEPPMKKTAVAVQKPASAPASAPASLPASVPATPFSLPKPSPRPAVSTSPSTTSSLPSMRKPFAVDESLSLQRHRHCKYLGQTTPLDASLIGLGIFNDKNETESQLGTLRQVTSTEYFSTHSDADVPIPDDEARALSDIDTVIGPHGPALIDIYFRNVHPSFPIIQRSAFLDRHQHGDRQFNPPLLAAMYLLALAWWEADPALSSQPKPDMAKLEHIAMTSLTIAMQRPKISAVQAGLLLLQRGKASTWTLTVQLVALGQDIGLHLDCSDWSIPRWERLLRKRLAWALYMQDKWSAMIYGRPSHINSSDWNVPLPTAEDFDESIHPLPSPTESSTPDATATKGRTIFLQMISLTNIMSEITTTFYSSTAKTSSLAAGPYASALILNLAKPVQLKLKTWFTTLPAECKMENYTPGQISPQGYLHLAYFATEISIHRRIITALETSPNADPYTLYICRSAAKTRLISALDFVNRMRPEHLSSFWYFPSPQNFALIGTFGALLMKTSPGKEEAHFYACRLNEFKWTLSVSCKKAAWIEGALETLEATRGLVRHMKEKPVVAPMSEMHYLSAPPTAAGRMGGALGKGCLMEMQMEMEMEDWSSGDEEMMMTNS